MPSLADLQAAHPKWCFNCGRMDSPPYQHFCLDGTNRYALHEALIAAKEADEKRIAELEAGFMYGAYARLKHLQECEAQLTAEREAHEATRQQLEDADTTLLTIYGAWKHSDETLDWGAVKGKQAALARQQARDKEPKP